MKRNTLSIKRLLIVVVSLLCSLAVVAQSPIIKTSYGQWVKMYLLNEFEEPDYNHPFLVSILNGQYYDLGIRFYNINGGGCSLTMKLRDGSTVYTESEATVSVKQSNGKITKIEIPRGSIQYGEMCMVDDDAVAFANAINNGNCKISIYVKTFYDIGEKSHNVFNCTNETRNILAAARNVLGYELSSSQQEDDFEAVYMGDYSGTHTLKGKINGKYAVTMKLTFNYGKVTGTYYYDAHKKVMKIEGDLANNGVMNLIEYDGSKQTGEYAGCYNGQLFIGDFENYASGRTMPFRLVTSK